MMAFTLTVSSAFMSYADITDEAGSDPVVEAVSEETGDALEQDPGDMPESCEDVIESSGEEFNSEYEADDTPESREAVAADDGFSDMEPQEDYLDSDPDPDTDSDAGMSEGTENTDLSDFVDELLENDVAEDITDPAAFGDSDISEVAEAEPEEAAFAASRIVSGVRVSVSAPAGVFPAGSRLSVKNVSKNMEIENAVRAERSKDVFVSDSYVFDIKVLCNGEEVEPDTSYGSVSVEFALMGRKPADVLMADVYHIVHEEEDLYAEKLDVETGTEIDSTATPGNMSRDEGGDTVLTVETDSFSYYVVEFTYETLQYVLEGGTSVELVSILESLGIEGEIGEVSVSNNTLFTAEQKDGVWTVTALQAFDTQEWMKVTVDGFEYEIIVTDAGDTGTKAGETLPTKMWVEPSEDNGIPSQIDVFVASTARSGSQYSGYTYTYTCQLCLPGNTDLSQTYLSWDGGMSVTVNGEPYTSGTFPVPSPDGGTAVSFSFAANNETHVYNVTTYMGSANVQRVFIEIDESGDNHSISEMDNDPDHNIECTGNININGQWYVLSKMKGRGNASWEQARDKRPYNITLGSKINFPGVDSAKTKKWSFLAEVLDHSLLCNRSGYYLAEELGIGQSTTSADVWMNGEYQGCYTVTPKTDSFVTDDGFMIEQDNYLEDSVAEGGDPQFKLTGLNESSGWSSAYNRITVKKMGDNLLMNDGVVDESPENMEAAAARIQAWLQDAWDAIRSDDGYNSKGKYYTDYIDIKSFAKMYLMHEYVKSYDVCAGSILFHRDGQTDADKLIAGPLWDLDNAMGSVYQNSSLGKADDRRNGDRRSGQGAFIPNITEYKTSIYKTISKHADFMEEVYLQYNKHRSAFDGLETDVAGMIGTIEASAMMNHNKVNDLGTGSGRNNHYYRTNTTLGSGQYQQVYQATTNSKTDWGNYAANLKTYIHTRSLWFSNTYYNENLDPEQHDHHYEETVITPATCIEHGLSTFTCPICHDSYDQVTDLIAHDYQDGICTVCGQKLINVAIECDEGTSVTVYETQDLNGACTENASVTNPRNSDTGMIDCSGDGQINFVVNVADGYELAGVTAEPKKSYKNFKLPGELGVDNYYRITKVNADFTIKVQIYRSVTFDEDNGTPAYTQQVVNGNPAVMPENYPAKDGCCFCGWYLVTDPDTGATADTPFDFENTLITSDITLKALWTDKYGEVYGKSLTLEGEIAVNFYLDLPESVTSDSEAYVTLTGANGKNEVLKVSEATKQDGHYRFPIRIVAKEMSDMITLKLYDGSGEVIALYDNDGTECENDQYEYSAMTYIGNKMSSDDPELVELVKEMSDYGHYAQEFFGYEVEPFEYYTAEEEMNGITGESLGEYAKTTEGECPEGVTSLGCSLILDAETDVRVYYEASGGHSLEEYTFMVDGVEAELEQNNKGQKYISAKNIAAKRLHEMHEFSVSNGEKTYTIRYGALSYCQSKISKAETEESLKNLCKSMALYNSKAREFFNY